MNNMRNKILSLLVLLLTAATGAWAADPKVYTEPVAISSLHVGDILAPGFSLTPVSYLDVIYFDAKRFKQDDSPMDSEWYVALNNIKSYGENAAITSTNTSDPSSDLTATPVDASGNDGNAWVVTSITENKTPMGDVCFIYVSGTYYEPPIEVKEVNPVTVSGATKQWEFDMPASDVLLTPVYAPVAAFAVENAGTANEKTLLPTAVDGVIAGTDVPIVTAGTTAQGTVIYLATPDATMTAAQAAAATGWSDALPKATVLTGNVSEPTTVYVWYYIAGADTPQGQTATAENTFNDSELCTAPLEVTLQRNVYALTLSPAPVENVTVTIGDATDPATPDANGKIANIKMGSEVKIKANTGYKLRKVEVKKNVLPTLTSATTDDVGKLVATDGSLFATADKATAAGKTAAAMVAYVSSTGHGLAIALSNEDSYPRYSNAGSTAAAHQPVVTGHAWSLPTMEDWQNMIIGCGNTVDAGNYIQISGLKTKLAAVGSSLPDGPYWTDTMADATYFWQFTADGNNASFFNRAESDWELSVRAVLAF